MHAAYMMEKKSDLCSASLQEWLMHNTSLTEKLYEKSGHTRLDVRLHEWKPRCWWSTYYLNISSYRVLTREILMYSQDQPCWYARTLIPEHTYERSKALFNRLNQLSLGKILFADFGIKRSWGRVFSLSRDDALYYWPQSYVDFDAENVWCRLAEYLTDTNEPFYLIEILLPNLMDVLC